MGASSGEDRAGRASPEPFGLGHSATIPCAERRGMFRVENIEDEMRDVVTFEIRPSGERVTFAGSMYRELGVVGLRRYLGMAPSVERLPVKQYGRVIGTLPDDFDPLAIRSTNFFYEPRSGDFVLRDGAWKAANNLGPGDLEAVPGFVWEPTPDRNP